MHRSGTSVLTGTLAKSGLELGPTFSNLFDNRMGNQESPWIMDLHEDILQRNGGSCDNPINPSKFSSPISRVCFSKGTKRYCD